jgi:hypothetical protein
MLIVILLYLCVTVFFHRQVLFVGKVHLVCVRVCVCVCVFWSHLLYKHPVMIWGHRILLNFCQRVCLVG